jgi:hypothetical protein
MSQEEEEQSMHQNKKRQAKYLLYKTKDRTLAYCKGMVLTKLQ